MLWLQVQIYELEEHKIETWRGLYDTSISEASRKETQIKTLKVFVSASVC